MKKHHFVLVLLFFSAVSFVFSQKDAGTEDAHLYAAPDAESTDATVTVLPHLYTYIDTPVAEQRETVTREDIEKMQVKTVSEVLASKGIQMLSYGAYGMQSSPSIRGFTGSTVRVVINGVCVNSVQNGAFDFTSLNLDDIEKIEIVRGAFTEDAAGQGAVGGVIYITTKKQSLGRHIAFDAFEKTYFNLSNPFDTTGVSFSFDGQLGDNTFLKTNVKGVFAQNAFPFTAYNGKTKYREDSQVIDGNTDTALTHYFGYGNSWYIGETTYDGRKEIPGAETSTTPGVQKDFNNKLSGGISFPSIKNNISASMSASWLCNYEKYDQTSQSSRHFLNTASCTGTAQYYGSDFWKQSLGCALNVSYLDSTDDESHLLADGHITETTKFFFTKAISEQRVQPQISLSLPMTFSFSGDDCAFVPKAGMCAEFTNVSLMLDGYRMCLFPNMNQLYWKDDGMECGNLELDPEDGWGGELTCSVKNSVVPFSVCVYSNYYFNKIQWQHVGGKWTPVNVASAFYAGCTVSASTLLFSCVTVKGEFEYLYNRLLAQGATYGKMIMYTPDIVASVCAVYDKNPLTISVDCNYVGKRYTDNSNLFALSPYVLLNASASFTADSHFTPYLRVDNILNWDYESVPDYPMPGISLTAGVKAKW
jgi:outer membrane cobalamin receptor